MCYEAYQPQYSMVEKIYREQLIRWACAQEMGINFIDDMERSENSFNRKRTDSGSKCEMNLLMENMYAGGSAKDYAV